jgi:hypothetical protein
MAARRRIRHSAPTRHVFDTGISDREMDGSSTMACRSMTVDLSLLRPPWKRQRVFGIDCSRSWRQADSMRGSIASFRPENRRGTMALMPNTTISVDAALKARLADLAGQTGQHVDEFVEALLRRIADADVRFDRGVPVFPRRPGAPTLSTEAVDRLVEGPDA